MLTEEMHAAGVADRDADPGADKTRSHEDAAHEKRNWVRLSYDCNNHCTFCLDSNAHDGTMRSNLDIKVQIIEGRIDLATLTRLEAALNELTERSGEDHLDGVLDAIGLRVAVEIAKRQPRLAASRLAG